MTYDEFKRQLGKAGLNISQFAKLIKQTPNSITNYSSHSEVPPHLAIISSLMGDMADAGLDFKKTLSKIEIRANKPRGGAQKGKFGGSKQEMLNLTSNTLGTK